MAALSMAWTIVIHVKSNAIVYADQSGALGVGAVEATLAGVTLAAGFARGGP